MAVASEHYTVLARRFRPQTFDDVIGQQHVAVALKNAIKHGRVAHAYLFTGARGVGKTSMARILAKALNCPNVVDAVPCHKCDVCEAIAAGHDVDVLEIDGASNRGIDDIRQLRANVNVKSMRSRFKVYIIDEVHMLTTDAFNALLKTLEEPPPSVKFVFCTTEPEKLLDTILSRCQRFDFALVETTSIADRLREIATAEGFTMTDAALDLLARRAAGSMRDSQSLLDQLLAFAEDTIDAEDVHRLLGTAPDDWLIAMVSALVEKDRSRALEMVEEALGSGVQLGELVDQLLRTLRDLLLIASGAATVRFLGVDEQHRSVLTPLAERWGLPTIVAATEILGTTKSQLNRASHARVLLDLAVVRLCLLEDLSALHDLIRELRTAGKDVALPTAARVAQAEPQSEPAGAPPAPPASRVPNGEKKKLDITPNVAPAATEPPVSREKLPWREDSLPTFLSQAVEIIDNRVSPHLQRARLAIFGPNDLELMFSRSYDFSKKICEKPENITQLERVFSSLAGQSVKVRFREIADESPSRAHTEHDRAENAADTLPVAEEHPFVSELMGVFNAKFVNVERHRIASASAAGDEDENPGDE